MKLGRPTKYDELTVSRICLALEKGLPLKLAANAAGVSHETLRRWRSEFCGFNDAIEQAMASGAEKRLDTILKAAEKGDVKAAQWWLKNVMPQYFGEARPIQETRDQVGIRF